MEDDELPSDIIEAYQSALKDSLPAKSAKKYVGAYELFSKWQESKGTTSFSEPVLMAYFTELSEKYVGPTLWSKYSMLKSTIICNQNINIGEYKQLASFVKRKNDGYAAKQAKVFTTEEMNKFLSEAPDEIYLAMKTVAIFGVVGACRGEETTFLLVDQVKDRGDELIITIPDTKTKIERIFLIVSTFVPIVRKYIQLRPKTALTNRFFVNYRNGKCTTQVIGKNSIGSMPKKIAAYLNLPHSELYTGHSFRRTSTTVLADSGASIEQIKCHGGWKSNAVAERYIAASLGNKRKIGNDITNAINFEDLCTTKKPANVCGGTTTKPATVTSSSLISNVSVASQRIEQTSTITTNENREPTTMSNLSVHTGGLSTINPNITTASLPSMSNLNFVQDGLSNFNERFGISMSNCTSISFYIGKQE